MSRNGRDHEKQVFSYMDGVPVKISENYKPPRKVVLPVGFKHKLHPESVMEEYDFKIERSVIARTKEWRKLQEAVEEKRKELARNEELVEKSCDTTEENSVSSNPNPLLAKSWPSVPNSNSCFLLPDNNILTPVPIRDDISAAQVGIIETKSPFNISDFESDTSSPFDNMELKTINDMEELAHVLQPSAVNTSPPEHKDMVKAESPQTYALVTNNEINYNYSLNRSGISYIPVNYSNSLKSCKEDIRHINGYSNVNFYNIEPKISDQEKWTDNWDLVRNISSLPKNYSQWEGYSIKNAPSGLKVSAHADLVSNISNLKPVTDTVVSHDEVITERLKDFETSPRHLRPQAICHHESLSRSVPDIGAEIDREVIEKRSSYSPSPLRPSSFGSTGLENWKPWPDLESPNVFPPQNKTENLEKKESPRWTSSLPDPFHDLSLSAQKVVEKISEMGFPLPRVSRICQQVGENDKKIIEILLHLQSLEEGGYSPDEAEDALRINNYELNRCLEYLEAMKQLMVLGFQKEQVSDALVQFNNDSDKALDHLIS